MLEPHAASRNYGFLTAKWGKAEQQYIYGGIAAIAMGVAVIVTGFALRHAVKATQYSNPTQWTIRSWVVYTAGFALICIGSTALGMLHKWQVRQIARTTYDLRDANTAYAALYALDELCADYQVTDENVGYPAVRFHQPLRSVLRSNEFRGGVSITLMGADLLAAGRRCGIEKYIAEIAGIPDR
jgi:predicted acyltransferase